ncbi:MAG: hypothetical protein QG572_367, partial [Pseudomonadota bacterium]|nr:hypothetical protein [Pseudomonadota bacterium]
RSARHRVVISRLKPTPDAAILAVATPVASTVWFP